MDRGYIDFERRYRITLESPSLWCAAKPTCYCSGATRIRSIMQPLHELRLDQQRQLDRFRNSRDSATLAGA
jgi:hypothetical protein